MEPELTVSARALNERQPREAAAHIAATLAAAGCASPRVISLLGVAFKGRPATNDVRGTMAAPVAAALRACHPDAEFRAFDAMVSDADVHALGFTPCVTLEDAFDGAQLVLIVNNHPAFSTMPVSELAVRMERPALIYDFWNTFRAHDLHLPDGVGFMALGSHGQARLPTRSGGQA